LFTLVGAPVSGARAGAVGTGLPIAPALHRVSGARAGGVGTGLPIAPAEVLFVEDRTQRAPHGDDGLESVLRIGGKCLLCPIIHPVG